MFESAELGHRIDGATYDAELPRLREALLEAQEALARERRFAVLVIVSGVDGAGKGETVNLLNEWMDPRHIVTHGFDEHDDARDVGSATWRYWPALPPKGKIGLLIGSWYSRPISLRMAGRLKTAKLDRVLERIGRFEEMLVDEGVLILKFWLHLSRAAQKKRLTQLERSRDTAWRVTKQDWKRFEQYDRFRDVVEHVLRQTSTAAAPWIVVEGMDARYRSLTVGRMLLNALRARLDAPPPAPVHDKAAPLLPAIDELHVLKTLDLSRRLVKNEYRRRLEAEQGRLAKLTRHPRFGELSPVAVFEGMDAAGKGGSIRRIIAAVDARRYRVVPIAAPTDEERAQPYLWRFGRHLPSFGRLTVFDRSWYGRVLVERVEGYCSESDWRRAYGEINDFEEELTAAGAVFAKFWLQISDAEQLRRFREREEIGFKRFKITDEDWRNRERWPQYEVAVCDMIDRTSTRCAPWTLVEAEDKQWARVKVLTTLCDRIEQALR